MAFLVALSIVGCEGAVAWRLFAMTYRAYEGGDASFLAGFAALVLCSSAYMLHRALRTGGEGRTNLPARVIVLGGIGLVTGFIGLCFAIVFGPHVAGFFVVWFLGAQIILIALAYRAAARWRSLQSSMAK